MMYLIEQYHARYKVSNYLQHIGISTPRANALARNAVLVAKKPWYLKLWQRIATRTKLALHRKDNTNLYLVHELSKDQLIKLEK